MTVLQAIAAFTVAAGLLTLTPGLDTALVLRTAAVEGPRRAGLAGLGVVTGCLAWGLAVAFGLGALLGIAPMAFEVLRWAGAAYLVYLAIGLLRKPGLALKQRLPQPPAGNDLAWLRRGLFTNLLNPKVGVFYVSFLPQFLPEHVPAASFIFLLALIHAGLGLAWFGVLIAATRPVAGLLQRPMFTRWLDRVTGGVFLLFAARLALEPR